MPEPRAIGGCFCFYDDTCSSVSVTSSPTVLPKQQLMYEALARQNDQAKDRAPAACVRSLTTLASFRPETHQKNMTCSTMGSAIRSNLRRAASEKSTFPRIVPMRPADRRQLPAEHVCGNNSPDPNVSFVPKPETQCKIPAWLSSPLPFWLARPLSWHRNARRRCRLKGCSHLPKLLCPLLQQQHRTARRPEPQTVRGERSRRVEAENRMKTVKECTESSTTGSGAIIQERREERR
jgi:hypothetical protein